MEEHKQSASKEAAANPPAENKKDAKAKNIGMAVIAYILFFVPLLTDAKDDPFVKFHVKQGLVLFIAGIILSIVGGMPIIRYFSWLLNIAVLVFVIIGIMNALNGKEEPLPVIGQFAENFKF
jgi:uncharacterized membrane protein